MGSQELQNQGEEFIHIDNGLSLKVAGASSITAIANLGGWDRTSQGFAFLGQFLTVDR